NGTNDEVVDYLMDARKRPQLYHIGHPDRSVREIRGDVELRRSIAHVLKTNALLRCKSPRKIIRHFRKALRRPRLPFSLWARPWSNSWDNPPARTPTPLCQIHWEFDPPGVIRYLPEAKLWLITGVIEAAAVVLLAHYLLVPMRAT